MRYYKSIFHLIIGSFLLGFYSCDLTSTETHRGPIILGDSSTIVTETNPKYLEDSIEDFFVLDENVDLNEKDKSQDQKILEEVKLVDKKTADTVITNKKDSKNNSNIAETAKKKPESKKDEKQLKSNIHKVKKGETLSSIAKKYNISEKQLMKINNLTPKSARTIKPGQPLKLN
ncbi:MAG TPA: LysM peptidoglycan-binding domain-containing protein [Edaphocola sp.]|nr:LysM peptidoglycan-binding domain-containing protein [Edaphocola sp.]